MDNKTNSQLELPHEAVIESIVSIGKHLTKKDILRIAVDCDVSVITIERYLSGQCQKPIFAVELESYLKTYIAKKIDTLQHAIS